MTDTGQSPREPDRPRRPGRSGGGRRREGLPFVWGLVAIVLIVIAGWLLVQQAQRGRQEQRELAPEDFVSEAGGGDRAVVLIFPAWDASSYVREERRLPSRDRLEEDLLSLMGALCDGPAVRGAASAMPAGTRALGAFYDESEGAVVLDFSRQLVTNHPGGSAAETATLTSILRSVALNFPAVRSCQILVEGAQSETLGGHLSLEQPFDPRRWL
jgi:spore germination protein GerM